MKRKWNMHHTCTQTLNPTYRLLSNTSGIGKPFRVVPLSLIAGARVPTIHCALSAHAQLVAPAARQREWPLGNG